MNKLCINCKKLEYKFPNEHGWPEISCKYIIFQGDGITMTIIRNLSQIEEKNCEDFEPLEK